MCPESFGGVRFDIILCMSRFNHVPSGDTLRRDTISSLSRICATFDGACFKNNLSQASSTAIQNVLLVNLFFNVKTTCWLYL